MLWGMPHELRSNVGLSDLDCHIHSTDMVIIARGIPHELRSHVGLSDFDCHIHVRLGVKTL